MSKSNVMSPTGKVHSTVEFGGNHYLLCNSWFNLGIHGWIQDWKNTDKEVTCRHCLRIYEDRNKVWQVKYYTKTMPDLTNDVLSAKIMHLVAPNRTEAALLFGRNMPKDIGHSKIDLRPLTMTELLSRKRML